MELQAYEGRQISGVIVVGGTEVQDLATLAANNGSTELEALTIACGTSNCQTATFVFSTSRGVATVRANAPAPFDVYRRMRVTQANLEVTHTVTVSAYDLVASDFATDTDSDLTLASAPSTSGLSNYDGYVVTHCNNIAITTQAQVAACTSLTIKSSTETTIYDEHDLEVWWNAHEPTFSGANTNIFTASASLILSQPHTHKPGAKHPTTIAVGTNLNEMVVSTATSSTSTVVG